MQPAQSIDHGDTSWCPVCDRQILPKRYTLPVDQPQAPAPPPSSPSKTSRAKTARAGLVHGTGRVKPNGAIKKPSTPPAAPTAIKQRTYIDQGPTPLYCSDECRLADLNDQLGSLAIDFNPEKDQRSHSRTPSVALDVPRPKRLESDADSETSSSASSSSTACSSGPKSLETATSWDETDPSIATLAALYGFPALGPPPVPLTDHDATPKAVRDCPAEYTGVIMAARRIKEVLSAASPSPKRSNPASRLTASKLQRDRKPIPGWTDGSGAWRSSVYSFAQPSEVTSDPRINEDRMGRAYKTFVASPHRSKGVYSTVSEDATLCATSSAGSLPSSRMDELYAKYPLSNDHRSQSRASLFPASAPCLPTRPESVVSRRREGILHPQAQGKLLVPDVKMRRTFSGSSITSAASARASRPLVRRGSGMSDETIDEAEEFRPSSMPAQPAVRTHSHDLVWAIMPHPMEKRTRIEKRVVDGVEQEVEVEYEVPKELKRLFLGPNGVSEGRERMKRERALAAAARHSVAV